MNSAEAEPRFIEGTTFTGAFFPRLDDQPDGPKLQSMVKCQCGAYWKHHRFVDGACPAKKKSRRIWHE